MLKIDALDKVRLLSVDEKARTTDDGGFKTNPEFPGAKQWGCVFATRTGFVSSLTGTRLTMTSAV